MRTVHQSGTDVSERAPAGEGGGAHPPPGGSLRWRHLLAALAALLVVSQLLGLLWPSLPFSRTPQAEAIAPGNAAFTRTWARTDRPIADGAIARTWMWGPEALTAVLTEPYAQAPGGARQVQYFDKSRMEITNPAGDADSIWYVTNGLLVMEMVSGQLQLGDAQFEARPPAQINVAGDPDDPGGPTYATFALLRNAPALADGAVLTQRLTRGGDVHDDPALAAHDVTAAFRVQVPGIEHQVASVFWAFMHQQGLIWDAAADAFSSAPLFESPFYATGYPLAEAYWTTVRVGGTPRDVLVQCFERRCLTWTPGNPPEWQVEAGNVGQHYLAWRSATTPPTATPPDSPGGTATATATATAIATTATPVGTSTVTIATATHTAGAATATRTPTTPGEPRPTRTPLPMATSTSPPTTATRTPTREPLPNMPDARALDNEEQAFLTALNAYRADNGLGPLVVSEALNCAAYGYSYDMATRNYFRERGREHETKEPFPAWLDGPHIADRVEFRGYTSWTKVDEIIAGGGAYEYGVVLIEVLKDDPGDNAIMLDPNLKHIGIGRFYKFSSNYKWYWTIDVGSRSAGAAACR